MPQLTPGQRKRAIELYQTQGSFRNAAVALNQEFPHLHVFPSTIQYQVKKLNTRFCLHNHNSISDSHGGSHSGRKRSARTARNIMDVLREILDTGKSLREVSRTLNLSYHCVHNIVRHDLLLKPYVLQVVPRLSDNHKLRRVSASAPLLELFRSGEVDPCFFFSTDEASVYLHGHVQVRNAVVWGIERPPSHFAEHNHQSKKVTVFAAVSSAHLFGPYFLPDGVNVNAESYRGLVLQLAEDMRAKFGDQQFGQVWFQQDGATAHTALQTRAFLQQQFGERLVSPHCTVDWPSCSPDLSMCDFFLWGAVKNLVYSHAPFANTNLLRACIREKFEEMRNSPDFNDTLQAVHRCFLNRLQKCMEGHGHFTELRVLPLL